ncbi:MAG: hypothetical protein ABI721_00690 [Candidatus Dojkabacteria bacterium]
MGKVVIGIIVGILVTLCVCSMCCLMTFALLASNADFRSRYCGDYRGNLRSTTPLGLGWCK